MTDCIIDMIENEASESFKEFITNDVQIILDIMTNASPKENRTNFAKVIKLFVQSFQ